MHPAIKSLHGFAAGITRILSMDGERKENKEAREQGYQAAPPVSFRLFQAAAAPQDGILNIDYDKTRGDP